MRGFFKRKEHVMPELNTSSLPDLIFTVLFFFMLVTHMRDVDLKVKYQVPQGTEVEKMDHKASIVYIYVGRSNKMNANESNDNDEFLIQLNNKVARLDDIPAFIEREKASMNEEDQSRMTVSIKADKDVPMGIIADIKQKLQESFALRINYTANEKPSGPSI